MAGKKIYLSPILEEIVGKVDTSLDVTNTKLQDVVNSVGGLMGDPEIPGQHSNLADVVNQLATVSADLTSGFGGMINKMQEQIIALGQVVGAASASVNKILVEASWDYNIYPLHNFFTGTIEPASGSGSETTKLVSHFKCFMSGNIIITFKANVVSSSSGNEMKVIVYDDNNNVVVSYDFPTNASGAVELPFVLPVNYDVDYRTTIYVKRMGDDCRINLNEVLMAYKIINPITDGAISEQNV